MSLKKNPLKFLILISKLRYKSETDSDYYYFITDSLKYCNYKYLSVEFNKNNKIINIKKKFRDKFCLLYTSDAADE